MGRTIPRPHNTNPRLIGGAPIASRTRAGVRNKPESTRNSARDEQVMLLAIQQRVQRLQHRVTTLTDQMGMITAVMQRTNADQGDCKVDLARMHHVIHMFDPQL